MVHALQALWNSGTGNVPVLILGLSLVSDPQRRTYPSISEGS